MKNLIEYYCENIINLKSEIEKLKKGFLLGNIIIVPYIDSCSGKELIKLSYKEKAYSFIIDDLVSINIYSYNIFSLYYIKDIKFERKIFIDDKFIKDLKQFLNLSESFDERLLKGNLYENMAILFHVNEVEDEALHFLNKSIKIYEEINNEIMKASAYCNMGKILRDINKFDDATIYFRDALKIYKDVSDKSYIPKTN